MCGKNSNRPQHPFCSVTLALKGILIYLRLTQNYGATTSQEHSNQPGKSTVYIRFVVNYTQVKTVTRNLRKEHQTLHPGTSIFYPLYGGSLGQLNPF